MKVQIHPLGVTHFNGLLDLGQVNLKKIEWIKHKCCKLLEHQTTLREMHSIILTICRANSSATSYLLHLISFTFKSIFAKLTLRETHCFMHSLALAVTNSIKF